MADFNLPQWGWFLLEIVVAPLVTFLLGIILQNKFGIAQKINKLYHKILNSKTEFTLNLFFDSNIDFSNVKDMIKDCFRKNYGTIKVYKNSTQTLEIQVNNSFIINVSRSGKRQIAILTSKIKTGLRSLTSDLDEFIKVIQECENKFQDKEKNRFIEKEATLHLYLPYKNKIAKIYTPKNIILKDYDIELAHKKYLSIIKLTLGVLRVNSNKKSDLEKVFKSVI